MHGGQCRTVIIPVSRRSVAGVMNNDDQLPCKRSDIQPLDRQYKKRHRDSSLDTTLRMSTCVYLMALHVTRSPRPSPAVFTTASDQILAVGMAWERG